MTTLLRTLALAVALAVPMPVAAADHAVPRDGSASAGPAITPTLNELHPAVVLRDERGAALPPGATAGTSAERTCGACHDATYIGKHSVHVERGAAVDCLGCHVRGGRDALEAAPATPAGAVTLPIAPPDAAACGRCHGLAQVAQTPIELDATFLSGDERGPHGATLRTGEVFAPPLVSTSLLNLAGKGALARAWDIHAARRLDCTSCHFAANNPEKVGISATHALAHLEKDPRGLSLAAYLKRPDHRLQAAACDDCHDPSAAHDSLPAAERHMDALACQACHVPRLMAPALRAADHTVVSADGAPRLAFRGVQEREFAAPNTWYVDGYRPFLLLETREGEHGDERRFAPYNLVARWDWVHGADGAVVPSETLDRAWRTPAGAHHPALVSLFDADGDGRIAGDELRLDSDEKRTTIRDRLVALGVVEPRVRGTVDAHAIRHGVVEGRWAAADCDSCHSPGSRLDESILLATGPFPGGVTPAPTEETKRLLGARTVRTVEGALVVDGSSATADRYVFGHSRRSWSDVIGFALLLLTVLGVAGHAGLRYRGARRRPKTAPAAPTKRVYMYGAYERVWHWTMAVGILLLLLTGFELHFPEGIGLLTFPTAVFVHDLTAVVLIVNAFLSLFFHLATGEIRQFVPHRKGLVGRLVAQARYYAKGIFVGAVHPSAKTPERKLNPLQQLTYVGLLNVLFPLQIGTGVLMWVGGTWPDVVAPIGGLAVLAPLHNLGSWLFLTFLVVHVYLTTTGHTLTSNLKAMVDGWEDVEVDLDKTRQLDEATSTLPAEGRGAEA